MPALSRRTVLLGAAAAGATVVVAHAAAADAVSLPSFREPGDPDDSAALRRALATGRPVHAPAAGGGGEGGRYVVGSSARDTLPSGVRLYGDGLGKTIFRIAPDYPFVLHCDSKSADPARNVADLRFADLTFESDVVRRGFSEFEYLVMLNGVTGARFERVGFSGFRGDGLHLGSSTVSKVERHNRDVVVRDCVFDGINANNRNAISILDCTNLTIENSRFLDCTRTGDGTANVGDPIDVRTGLGMPGPIDIEPNLDAFAVVRNIVIRGNYFRGGGGYAVALHPLPNTFVTTPQTGILIVDNIIEKRVGGIDMTGYAGLDAMGEVPGYAVTVRRNRITGCATPFRFSGGRGMIVEDNLFADCTDRAELGHLTAIADVLVRRNRFERIGSDVAPFGVWIRDCDRVSITDNDFVDCGGPGGQSGTALALVAGTPRRLEIAGNRFASPLGRMDKALLVFRDARPDPRSITVRGNRSTLTGPTMQAALGL